MNALLSQITIIGTGLVGGSLGLALKRAQCVSRVVGCDRAKVLERALELGAIDRAEPDPLKAIAGSQVVVLAAPIMANMDLLMRVAPTLEAGVLLTDTGSTKSEILRQAERVFGDKTLARFLPGHPMAGKERGGIDAASADLFRGASWILTPPGGKSAVVSPEFTRGPHAQWLQCLEAIGARIVVLDAERHDRTCAYTSHLPQMLSTALAATIVDELQDEAALPSLSGPGLRDMVRLSGSEYQIWRDIALTNTKNLDDALFRMEQKLAHIRENLKTRELEAEFARAHELDLETPPEERKKKDDTDPPKFW
jgi:prephenate dehydrogenase